MQNRSNLAYFLNELKDELGFETSDDFANKIENSFNFRFKVQKFVFLAKYFGWDNGYRFTLYPRGPYSSALAEDYYSDVFDNVGEAAADFNMDTFKEFACGKSEYDLEATSTILYCRSLNGDFSLDDALTTLNRIKPHINSSIVERAYQEIINLPADVDIVCPISSSGYLENLKSALLDKILLSISIFEKFELSHNSKFIVLSLNYLKNVLINETLKDNLKNDLFGFISRYLSKIDEIQVMSNDDGVILKNMNLNKIEEFFNRLENYIGHELNILSGFSEYQEFDIHRIYAEYYLILDFILDNFVEKYDDLITCELYFKDECGRPAFEYFIKSKEKLSYTKRKSLTHEIIEEVYDFCLSSDLVEIFKTISIFLVNQ